MIPFPAGACACDGDDSREKGSTVDIHRWACTQGMREGELEIDRAMGAEQRLCRGTNPDPATSDHRRRRRLHALRGTVWCMSLAARAWLWIPSRRHVATAMRATAAVAGEDGAEPIEGDRIRGRVPQPPNHPRVTCWNERRRSRNPCRYEIASACGGGEWLIRVIWRAP
jgi:hypothetical protein